MAKNTLDIKKLLREGGVPTEGEMHLAMEARTFDGYAPKGPVRFAYKAKPQSGMVRLEVELQAELAAECVRCLDSFEMPLLVRQVYDMAPEDLEGEYTEYPAAAPGVLDLEELAYGEILLNMPSLLLCSEECEGLCQQCGEKKARCGCGGAQEGDARWQVLRDLLKEEKTR